MILSGGGDNTARLWDLASGTSRVLRGQTDVAIFVTFSPDGKRLAVASADQTVRMYELEALRDRVIAVHGAAVQSTVASPAGDRVAFAGTDGLVRVTAASRTGRPRSWLSMKER